MENNKIELCDDFTCGNDFYNYVNSNWIKSIEIPDEHQRWGTFEIIREKTLVDVNNLILQSHSSPNKNFKKVGILYNQLINNDYKHPSNFFEIYKLILDIENCSTKNELFNKVMEYDLTFGLDNIIGLVVNSNFLNPTENILHLISHGLGLPDRNYYFDKDKESIRLKYFDFIKKYSLLFNRNIEPLLIFNLEKILAEKTYSNVEKRNPEILNNLTTWDDLITKCPNLIFINKIFEYTGKKPGVINNTNPKYIDFINEIIPLVPISTWKQFFVFKIMLEFNKYLSNDIKQTYFDFYEKTLSGTIRMKPGWKQAIDIIDDNIGELVGQMYINKYFDVESKKLAYKIFKYIKAHLRDYLTNNDWMEQETKNKAIEKLNKINIKIGYPDKFLKNYNHLNISESFLLIQNILNIRKFNINYTLKKLYEPVDKSIWFMNPQSVNAYYSPFLNEIVFPAGILQEPFFSPKQDMASNFGAFGMVIGHEITHGFDDQGSKFDSDGKLNQWWTDNDKKKYKLKTDVVKNQYSKYKLEGKYINGEFTLGENIADIGGLNISYNAFKRFLLDNPEHNIITNGLTPHQKFFISYANLWKVKARKEDIIKRIITDPHSPPEFRVNGVVRNIDNFYTVFNLKNNDSLYLEPELRARIWS